MKTETNSNADNFDSQIYQPGLKSLSNDAESEPDVDAASEIARLLDLAAAQINLAARESDPAVAVLTDVFSNIVERSESVANGVRRIQDRAANVERDGLQAISGQLSADTQSALVALQFYDRLTQRLRHVSDSLEMLSALARNKHRLNSPSEWEKLKQTLRQSYSGETEKTLFDAVMGVTATADATPQAGNPGKAELPAAVELF